MRGSIVWAGLIDPDTRETLAEQSDDETEVLRRLMDGWGELGACTVASAVKMVREGNAPLLQDLLAEIPGDPSAFSAHCCVIGAAGSWTVGELCGNKVAELRRGNWKRCNSETAP